MFMACIIHLMGLLILITGIFCITLSKKLRSTKKIKPRIHKIVIIIGWMVWSAGAVFCLFSYRLTHAVMFIVGSLIAKEIIGSLKD